MSETTKVLSEITSEVEAIVFKVTQLTMKVATVNEETLKDVPILDAVNVINSLSVSLIRLVTSAKTMGKLISAVSQGISARARHAEIDKIMRSDGLPPELHAILAKTHDCGDPNCSVHGKPKTKSSN